MTNTDPIKALVGLEAELRRLNKGATGDPWQTSIRMHTTDPLEILGNIDGDADDEGRLRMISTLVAELADNEEADSNADLILFLRNNVRTILAAIEAIKRPPSPAPVDDGELVERVDDYMKRIHRIEEMEKDILMLRDALKPFANLDFGGYTLPQNEQIIMRFEASVREINKARAALAAIKEGE